MNHLYRELAPISDAGWQEIADAAVELSDDYASYPVLEHVQRLVDGPLVWAPGLDGAVVMSMRGDDFQLTVGQDFSIGYVDHDAERVRLYIEESFTFWLQSPQAAVPLVFPETNVPPRRRSSGAKR